MIEFTTTAKNDYTKGVDIQTARTGSSGTTCFATLLPPGGSLRARRSWRGGARATRSVEGNTFVNCARGVMFGADDYYSPSHAAASSATTSFFRTGAQPGDVGIILSDSPDTQILNNTLYLSGTYGSAIEYRYAGTRNALIAQQPGRRRDHVARRRHARR